MNLLALKALLLLLVGGHVATAGTGYSLLMDPAKPLKRCHYLRTHDLFTAQCRDLKLEEVPGNLQAGIEVLDARENRIRELSNKTLSRYTSLRFLYLQDNFVHLISEQAFAPTYYLEVLDLTKNGLIKLTRSIFQLKWLRNLYLNDNLLTDEVFDVQDVRSPLIWLHLSRNKLTRLPRLSPLPTLLILNVSYNHISHISVDEVAPICSLQVLDLLGNDIQFNQSSCECYEFKEWLTLRQIKLKFPLNCPVELRERCSIVEFNNRTLGLYNDCVTSLRNRAEAQKARSTWIWIASCVGAFMACIFIALCCMHKRNKNKRQRLKEQKILAANNANTEQQLLNKDINSEQS